MATSQQRLQLDSGTPYSIEGKKDSDPGNIVEMFTFTVPPDTQRNLTNVKMVCRQEGFWELFEAGNIIGSGRTGAAQPDSVQEWHKPLPLSAGNVVKLQFTQRANSPIVSCEAYLVASDQTV